MTSVAAFSYNYISYKQFPIEKKSLHQIFVSAYGLLLTLLLTEIRATHFTDSSCPKKKIKDQVPFSDVRDSIR